MRRLRAAAPAKINLGLRITGRRANGFHELESVFVPLDLADEVAVAACGAEASEVVLALEGEGAGVPADRGNLAVRAAERLLEIAGLSCSVRIRLTKRIPAAAGLGGASSDAGAVLRSLAELFPNALSPGALASLALDLGADVPFFLDPKPALVRGIGERVEALPEVPALALLVAHPGIPLSTAQVYRAFDALGPALAPGAAGRPSLRPLSRLRRDAAPDPAVARLLENDLEPAAVRLCPPIARLREAMRAAGALAVGMSGSGPTVYGVFEDEAAAASALGRPAFEPPIWARVAATEKSR